MDLRIGCLRAAARAGSPQRQMRRAQRARMAASSPQVGPAARHGVGGLASARPQGLSEECHPGGSLVHIPRLLPRRVGYVPLTTTNMSALTRHEWLFEGVSSPYDPAVPMITQSGPEAEAKQQEAKAKTLELEIQRKQEMAQRKLASLAATYREGPGFSSAVSKLGQLLIDGIPDGRITSASQATTPSATLVPPIPPPPPPPPLPPPPPPPPLPPAMPPPPPALAPPRRRRVCCTTLGSAVHDAAAAKDATRRPADTVDKGRQ